MLPFASRLWSASLVPSGDAVWPHVDADNEVYQEDFTLRVMNRGGRQAGAAEHGHHAH